ncbi:MAG: orotate phosphoribosyltransferase [Bdellovibrionaceae bacterium]|nr:orotate phosphoribosyltransferase [Pseudobdellovibrionaceae bacterium]
MLNRDALAQEIFHVAHLRGEFKLRSGQVSNEYFDKYQFESDPRLLSQIAEHMKSLVPKGTEYLGALEMGGIPIATALSLITGIPVIFVRKTAKDYGTCKFAEGPPINGRKICLVEDVITTGGQVVTSAQDLRSDGALIDTVLCVIDRSEGKTEKLKMAELRHLALFTMAELKKAGGVA